MGTATRSSRFLQRTIAATFAALSLAFAPPALYAAPDDAPDIPAVTEFRHQEQQAAQARGVGRRSAQEALLGRREVQAVDQLIALGAQPIPLEPELPAEVAAVLP